MTELVLKPSIHDFAREDVEAFLEVIRVKRMSAAMEYFADKNAKIAHEQEKIQKKFMYQVEMLGKEIEKCQAAEGRIEKRLINIEMLKQEMGLLVEQLVDTTPQVFSADPDEEE